MTVARTTKWVAQNGYTDQSSQLCSSVSTTSGISIVFSMCGVNVGKKSCTAQGSMSEPGNGMHGGTTTASISISGTNGIAVSGIIESSNSCANELSSTPHPASTRIKSGHNQRCSCKDELRTRLIMGLLYSTGRVTDSSSWIAPISVDHTALRLPWCGRRCHRSRVYR